VPCLLLACGPDVFDQGAFLQNLPAGRLDSSRFGGKANTARRPHRGWFFGLWFPAEARVIIPNQKINPAASHVYAIIDDRYFKFTLKLDTSLAQLYGQSSLEIDFHTVSTQLSLYLDAGPQYFPRQWLKIVTLL
jgi:hypothetical protein